jgi:dihydrodipicolinate synthase/N-acetylneuraminate lyase
MSAVKKLEGVIPAVITPFDEKGNVLADDLQKQVSYLVSAGVHGLFINGSTGEGGHLSTEEKVEIYKIAKEAAGEAVAICAACLQPSTDMVLAEIRVFEKLEPDYFVAVTPYYYGVSQSVIAAHYREIASQSSVPVILYNIPGLTHNKMGLEVIQELAGVENIAGIKDSSADFATFSRGILANPSADFPWIQGEDLLDGPSLLVGAKGMVTGLGNVWIDPYVAMYEASLAGDAAGVLERQRQVHRLYRLIFTTGGQTNAAIKTAVCLLGRGSTRWMRTLSMSLNEEEVARVEAVLKDMKLL